MRATVFVDTNVLLYARDASEPDKPPRARAWVDALWAQRRARLSYQVLDEYYAVLTRKLRPGLDRESAQADVRDLMAWRPVAVEEPQDLGGVEVVDPFTTAPGQLQLR